MSPGAGAEAWDKRLLGIGFLMTQYMLVAAGLDSRHFNWGAETDGLWVRRRITRPSRTVTLPKW